MGRLSERRDAKPLLANVEPNMNYLPLAKYLPKSEINILLQFHEWKFYRMDEFCQKIVSQRPNKMCNSILIVLL